MFAQFGNVTDVTFFLTWIDIFIILLIRRDKEHTFRSIYIQIKHNSQRTCTHARRNIIHLHKRINIQIKHNLIWTCMQSKEGVLGPQTPDYRFVIG